ncbi:MAG TPA: hypothetical protein VGK67_37370 [Myxococcales bacterium]|jgi:hypothetical protein
MRSALTTAAVVVGLLSSSGALAAEQRSAKPAARPPIVLDGRALRFRAPELGTGVVAARSVTAEGGKALPVASKDLVRLPDGWFVLTVPEGVSAGTVTLAPQSGPPQTFAFVSSAVAPAAANPKWDAARRAQCLALAGAWFGKISGNDPDVRASVSLEIDADCRTVYGILHWRSALSGINDRVLRGTWDAEKRALSAADVRLNVDQPAHGFRFCTIDRYTLALSADGTRLEGEYWSEECRDRAKVELARPEQPAAR